MYSVCIEYVYIIYWHGVLTQLYVYVFVCEFFFSTFLFRLLLLLLKPIHGIWEMMCVCLWMNCITIVSVAHEHN